MQVSKKLSPGSCSLRLHQESQRQAPSLLCSNPVPRPRVLLGKDVAAVQKRSCKSWGPRVPGERRLKGGAFHSDKERADQFGSLTKHVEWAAAFMHHYPIKSFVYWNQYTILRDPRELKHLTGMVLDQAIGFERADFTPADFKLLVSTLIQDFIDHPNNPLVRKAQLSPVAFGEIWKGEALACWPNDIRSGLLIKDATLRLLN